MNRLPFGIGDFMIELKEAQTTVKGDVPGHEFHGNQYSDGGGSSGDSDSGSSSGSSSSSGRSGSSKEPPAPKISNGYKLHDQFTTKKGTSIYAIQKPADESERGWIITRSSRVNNRSYSSFGKPIHTIEMRDTKDEIQKEYDNLKKYEG